MMDDKYSEGTKNLFPPLQHYEREFFINRICAGYLRYKSNDITLRIYSPDSEWRYEAAIVAKEAYEQAKEQGLYEDPHIFSLLTENGWTEEDENNLTKVLPDHIDYWKVQLYQNALRFSEVKRLREYLNTAKNEFIRLLTIRHQFDYATCEGVSNYAKWHFLVSNLSKYSSGTNCNWADVNLSQTINFYHSNVLSDVVIRYLSRTEPWSNLTQISKYTAGLFDKAVTDLSDEQRKLLMWTSLYQNIGQAHNCPSQDIIEDDDMLDGWLIVQRKEREKEQKENKLNALLTNGKIAKSGEIFIPVENKKAAQEITSLNNPYAEQIRKSRISQVEKAGELREDQLADVKMNLRMQATQLMRDGLKKGKK